MKVPQLDLQSQFESLREEMLETVNGLFESQRFILGAAVEDFETRMAEYLGSPGAVGVSSGSEALRVALAVLELGPGDEVLLPAFTFFATAGAVVHAGARPVFVDVTEDFLMDPEDAARRCTPACKAAIPVHLYGLQAPWKPLRELAEAKGLLLVEDAAQSLGARREEGRAASLGDAAAMSFFPSKNLGGAGDGGMVTFRDAELTERARRYRVHGESRRYHHEEVGINGRLDALQAAVLGVKLGHLDEWNRRRRERAARYEALFAASKVADRVIRPALPAGEEHVFHQYTIRVPRRDQLQERLQEEGVGTAVYYPVPLHRQKCFADLPGLPESLPVTERLAAEVLSLPIYPELGDEQQDYVVERIEAFLA